MERYRFEADACAGIVRNVVLGLMNMREFEGDKVTVWEFVALRGSVTETESESVNVSSSVTDGERDVELVTDNVVVVDLDASFESVSDIIAVLVMVTVNLALMRDGDGELDSDMV